MDRLTRQTGPTIQTCNGERTSMSSWEVGINSAIVRTRTAFSGIFTPAWTNPELRRLRVRVVCPIDARAFGAWRPSHLLLWRSLD
jgi:hypothetical protein